MKTLSIATLFLALFTPSSFAQGAFNSAQCWNDGPTFPGELKLNIDRSQPLTADQVFQMIDNITSTGFEVMSIYTYSNVQSIHIIRHDFKKYKIRHSDQYSSQLIQESDAIIQKLVTTHPEITSVDCIIKACGSIRVGGCK